MSSSGTSRARRGFTLIELLIAVAVASVLVAIALPSFFEQLARARRTDVQAALLEDAGYMQHYYSSHNAYADTPAPQLPSTRTPRSGAASYAISVSVPADDPTSFVLTAVRSGAMSSDPCGDFTYDNLGQRDLVAGTFAVGRDAGRCWR
ncbi:MAG: prepilin-type N-terminal cleavage/methylation domain-containing protein [Pseudomonadota bacterium]|nr:prepilin-type N-terminal cleavage/methylation domain-containing protein [Pseudomonadota bacterium]